MKRTIKSIWIIFAAILVVISITGCSSETQNQDQDTAVPQFEQPESAPDIMGVVKSIVGNEVTITQYDLSNMQTPTTTDQEETKNSIIGTVGFGGGRMGPNNGGNGEFDPSAMFENMESLGDIKVLIPVGIKMIKGGMPGKNGGNASLEDVKKDGMLTIWLDKSVTDRSIAEFVMIRNM